MKKVFVFQKKIWLIKWLKLLMLILIPSMIPLDVTAMQAIGYKEALAYLDGEAAREEAIDEIKLRSRQYAKRQLTWLRRDPGIHWFYWKKTRILPDCLAFSTEILHTYGVS